MICICGLLELEGSIWIDSQTLTNCKETKCAVYIRNFSYMCSILNLREYVHKDSFGEIPTDGNFGQNSDRRSNIFGITEDAIPEMIPPILYSFKKSFPVHQIHGAA